MYITMFFSLSAVKKLVIGNYKVSYKIQIGSIIT